MCDYSLAAVPNRLAVAGEELVVYKFEAESGGLASAGARNAMERRSTRWSAFWCPFIRTTATGISATVVSVVRHSVASGSMHPTRCPVAGAGYSRQAPARMRLSETGAGRLIHADQRYRTHISRRCSVSKRGCRPFTAPHRRPESARAGSFLCGRPACAPR